MHNKKKIINDPVHGFITIPDGLHYDIIQHPYFQRLNRIKQLGLSYTVYPGAHHTRFQHSLGAMHLMSESIAQLRSKGHEITDEEASAVLATILLHDVGHAPFSHVLEHTIAEGISHEEISLLMMREINKEMNGALDLAIEIFQNTYHKQFLHQLVSSQLDMDRLDYLIRDSFFTGVVEGAVGAARIIKMLDVHDDRLVVEAKGIYSIEKFLVARRMMYWQVYLHKTSLAAEQLLIKILQRAKELSHRGEELFGAPQLLYFLQNDIKREDFQREETLRMYALFDDSDIMSAIKVWVSHPDKVLSLLCQNVLKRKLFRTKITEEEIPQSVVDGYRERLAKGLDISLEETRYFMSQLEISTYTYKLKGESIMVHFSDGSLRDIVEVSDLLNLSLMSKHEKKYYFCHLKDFDFVV